MPRQVIIDAGHGGYDNGAVYNDRKEKDDNLALALAVGEILAKNGVEVAYTRTSDIYQSPTEKARIANSLGGDLFVSLHRNSSQVPNTYSGVQSLIYSKGGLKEEAADEINDELEDLGFQNLGIALRPDLIVLRRTQMPAVLVEAGFINTDEDNRIFDTRFGKVAEAIADGIMEALKDAPADRHYFVQVGLFRQYNNALNLQNQLLQDGFESVIIKAGEYYTVLVGGFQSYEQAAAIERALSARGYETLIVMR
ncbi:N-acetylmuramoyl-L-alanine amidase [Anaerolentibacter hominis]|uniref:N-acetylmuramoyl-L-alanine amidase n=1 Tax=Anaerolentibacter hominis TaxID=3079009 RepID=UPI0031B851EB